jgi:hypothetical protein
MFKLKKVDKEVKILWGITFILLVFAIISYFGTSETLTGFLVGLFGVAAMLSIALQTFLKMDESTKETIKAIARTSRRQIKKFNDFIKKIEETNITLNFISESLKIVASEVTDRQKLIPSLGITFENKQEKIDIRAGEECSIVICLHNLKKVNAPNPYWSLFVPPEIKIIDQGNFKMSIQSGRGTAHPNYAMLFYSEERFEPSSFLDRDIKIMASKAKLGEFTLPFYCSCDGVEEMTGNLLINVVG